MVRPGSSAGQSKRLLSFRSGVRVPPGVPIHITVMKNKLLLLIIQFVVLALVSYALQMINPDSLYGAVLFMFGAVFVLGINSIFFLLSLIKQH